jgi:pimeloyl-ACP methyl ester carboxylesterase
MRFLFCLIFLCSFAHGEELPVGWNEYLATKKQHVSHPRHLPYVLSHGKKTAHSVLLVHGIFSSPLRFRQMAEAFYRDGHNVVTVLLPGHWDKDWYSMSKISETAWVNEVAQGWEFARQMGGKVILAGHSLGALLLIEQAQLHPQEVHGLVIFSPALKINSATSFASQSAVAIGLDGNVFVRQKPDGVEVPWFSPHAAKLITRTYQRILNVPLAKVPMFMAYTVADPVLDVNALKSFYWKYPSEKKAVLKYKLTSGVNHANIGQSPKDESAVSNPYFDKMMARALDAVHSWQ